MLRRKNNIPTPGRLCGSTASLSNAAATAFCTGLDAKAAAASRPLPLLAGRQAPWPFHKRIWYIPETVGTELNLLALLPKQGLINQTT